MCSGVKAIRVVGLMLCTAATTWTEAAEPTIGTTGSYKGLAVTASVKGKQDSYNLDGVTTRYRNNHLMKVELRFERIASTPSELEIKNRFAVVSIQEIEVRAGTTVYPALLAPIFASVGLAIEFDKSLATGKATFYVEVPKETVCSEMTLKLADSVFRFDPVKFPKSCR